MLLSKLYCRPGTTPSPHPTTMAAAAALPVLLPTRSLPAQDAGSVGWKPKRNLEIPNPPPPEDPKALEMDMARQLADGKPVKKIRPRRTVDYGGAMGRWSLVSCLCYKLGCGCAYCSPFQRVLVSSVVWETDPTFRRGCRIGNSIVNVRDQRNDVKGERRVFIISVRVYTQVQKLAVAMSRVARTNIRRLHILV